MDGGLIDQTLMMMMVQTPIMQTWTLMLTSATVNGWMRAWALAEAEEDAGVADRDGGWEMPKWPSPPQGSTRLHIRACTSSEGSGGDSRAGGFCPGSRHDCCPGWPARVVPAAHALWGIIDVEVAVLATPSNASRACRRCAMREWVVVFG